MHRHTHTQTLPPHTYYASSSYLFLYIYIVVCTLGKIGLSIAERTESTNNRVTAYSTHYTAGLNGADNILPTANAKVHTLRYVTLLVSIIILFRGRPLLFHCKLCTFDGHVKSAMHCPQQMAKWPNHTYVSNFGAKKYFSELYNTNLSPFLWNDLFLILNLQFICVLSIGRFDVIPIIFKKQINRKNSTQKMMSKNNNKKTVKIVF